MNMPTTIARVAVPLSARSSVGSCASALGSAAKDARGEHTAAAVARAAAGTAAGNPDCALICTVCLIATETFASKQVSGGEGQGGRARGRVKFRRDMLYSYGMLESFHQRRNASGLTAVKTNGRGSGASFEVLFCNYHPTVAQASVVLLSSHQPTSSEVIVR